MLKVNFFDSHKKKNRDRNYSLIFDSLIFKKMFETALIAIEEQQCAEIQFSILLPWLEAFDRRTGESGNSWKSRYYLGIDNGKSICV